MPATILVVEDNWIAGEIARTALESRGHSVSVATTGRNALEWMANQECDLILLDLMLPDTDGAHLLEILRRLPGGEHIPILAFSAFVSRLDDLRRNGAAFDGYMAKPVEPEDLIRIVEENLHTFASRRVGDSNQTTATSVEKNARSRLRHSLEE